MTLIRDKIMAKLSEEKHYDIHVHNGYDFEHSGYSVKAKSESEARKIWKQHAAPSEQKIKIQRKGPNWGKPLSWTLKEEK